MAKVNCSACEEIRELSPELVVNGWSSEMCASMANDTGLSPSSGHNDCTDLELMNDCLIGNLDAEVDAYEVCDWKTFMHRFLPNLWTLFSAIKCAICGIWTNIHKLWAEIEKIWDNIKRLWQLAERLDCIVNYMNKGADFAIGESETAGSYIVAGKGCSFIGPSDSDDRASDLHLTYIAGGLGRLTCSIDFHASNFTDGAVCYNYDNDGVNPQRTKSRTGNSEWGNTGKPIVGGELAYEIRIKKSQYPQLKAIWSGNALSSDGSAFIARFCVFGEGGWAYGQHGWCHSQNHPSPGSPGTSGASYGHQVPAGWIYIQCRIDYIMHKMSDGGQYTPQGWVGIRLGTDDIKC